MYGGKDVDYNTNQGDTVMKKISLFIFLLCGTILTNAVQTPEELLQTLSLKEKIGQLFMVAAVADEEIAKDIITSKPYRMDKEYIEELICDYGIGGIIYLGKSDPEKQIMRTAHFQRLSTIPLLVGQDLEPGRIGTSQLPDFFDFPSNKALGTIEDNDLIYQTGLVIGTLCKALGVHINFAPVVDVNNNPDNSIINDRSFGNNQELVVQKAIPFMYGSQDVGILACAKHFPGHGDTNVDSHLDLPFIGHDKERLYEIELYPFVKMINAGVACIMTAHLEIPAFEQQKNLPSSLSKNIVTDLLQKELGFKGLVITDSLHMYGVTKFFNPGEYELYALLAGNDILLCPFDVPLAIESIKKALEDGRLSQNQLDAHVLKILEAKEYVFLHNDRIPTMENFRQLNVEEIAAFKERLGDIVRHS